MENDKAALRGFIFWTKMARRLIATQKHKNRQIQQGDFNMLAKKIKAIRDMNDEVEVLDRKIVRELSKLNDTIRLELKKRLKKVVPGISVKFKKVCLNDFIKNKKRDLPLEVAVVSLNGKMIHKDGFWVEEDEKTCQIFKTDNRIDADHFEQICQEVSEDLGVNLQVLKVSGKYQ
jgi:hypothetical protein